MSTSLILCSAFVVVFFFGVLIDSGKLAVFAAAEAALFFFCGSVLHLPVLAFTVGSGIAAVAALLWVIWFFQPYGGRWERSLRKAALND